MEQEAMGPHGLALMAYHRGDRDATLLIRRDDGQETPMPVGFFFRRSPDIPEIEKMALDLCSGHVLDIGAGTGVHSLELQARGLELTAVDICPEAVKIMIECGVIDARLVDIFDFPGGSFNTLLILGHGIGVSGDLAGLDRFLIHSHTLIKSEGCLLLDSMDVRETDDAVHLAYHERNRLAGKYFGISELVRDQRIAAGRRGFDDPYSEEFMVGR